MIGRASDERSDSTICLESLGEDFWYQILFVEESGNARSFG